MDRRVTLKWMLAVAAAMPILKSPGYGIGRGAAVIAYVPPAKGYGTDPNLQQVYRPGELWQLTFTPEWRRLATALSDLIIPADANSPSASQVGVVDFLDEWVSAPYEQQRQDRAVVLAGFKWLEHQSMRRFSRSFVEITEGQRRAICDDICYLPQAKSQFTQGAEFFARYRDLTAAGFYTTPAGRKDLRYVGNTPLESFDGPPLELLKRVGVG